MKKTYSTKDIFNSIHDGNTIDQQEISFYTEDDLRKDLEMISADIEKYITTHKTPSSFNEFAREACITPSHLNQFLNGKKKMTKYYLLRIFITLGYDLDKVNSLLQRFDGSFLYARNKRDYIIMNGIVDKLSIDDIDSVLRAQGLEALCPVGNYE
ncbi:MAG: helix-turn-helix domain-containing protein [Eubacterium sp.]|nr:helix-turn-helix domain-containing protein [Eubacterium sp.]